MSDDPNKCDDCGEILPEGYEFECPDCEQTSYERATEKE